MRTQNLLLPFFVVIGAVLPLEAWGGTTVPKISVTPRIKSGHTYLQWSGVGDDHRVFCKDGSVNDSFSLTEWRLWNKLVQFSVEDGTGAAIVTDAFDAHARSGNVTHHIRIAKGADGSGQWYLDGVPYEPVCTDSEDPSASHCTFAPEFCGDWIEALVGSVDLVSPKWTLF